MGTAPIFIDASFLKIDGQLGKTFRNGRKYVRISASAREDILKMYEAGLPIQVIAHKYGVDMSYPGLLVKRRGLVLRRCKH